MKSTYTLSELSRITQTIWGHIVSQKIPSHATVVCLHGDLGAGKTTLVTELAKLLNIEQPIQSPTFVILKNYPIQHQVFTHLIHIDAYRLQSEAELEKLNWSNYYHNQNNLIIMEWSELVPKLIPDNAVHVQLEHINETTRSIEIKIHT